MVFPDGGDGVGRLFFERIVKMTVARRRVMSWWTVNAYVIQQMRVVDADDHVAVLGVADDAVDHFADPPQRVGAEVAGDVGNAPSGTLRADVVPTIQCAYHGDCTCPRLRARPASCRHPPGRRARFRESDRPPVRWPRRSPQVPRRARPGSLADHWQILTLTAVQLAAARRVPHCGDDDVAGGVTDYSAARRSAMIRSWHVEACRKVVTDPVPDAHRGMATAAWLPPAPHWPETQPEPVAPAKPPALARTTPALVGLQIPTPNTLLTAATGTWTTGAAGGSGVNWSGAGLLGALTGLVPTSASGVAPASRPPRVRHRMHR